MSAPRRFLVVASTLRATGGGDHLSAVALEALVDAGEVTLVQWGEPDFDEVNRLFGTSLRRDALTVVRPGALFRGVVALLPFHLDLLRKAILFRMMRRSAGRYDAVVSLMNEIDVGAPAIQYVHYPWGLLPRPESDLRWYHFEWLLAIYYALVRQVIGIDERRVATNLTLVNSSWTGARFAERYRGASSVVLHPPVAPPPPGLPWTERENRFVAIGRISPEKRLEDAIEIVERLRARGHDATLSIVGIRDDAAYRARIAQFASSRGWVTLHERVPADALQQLLARSRYGIHAMRGEHFGIAVAQLAAGGCLPFVQRDGGPAEIVGDARLTFDSVDEAVERADAVLRSDALQLELRRALEGAAERFGTARFRARLLREFDHWIAARGLPRG